MSTQKVRKSRKKPRPYRFTTPGVVARFREIHGDKYDYSNAMYEGYESKVAITCRTHGDFYQSPHNHLAGFGCPKCKADKMRLSQHQVVAKFTKVHGDTYDYSKFIYTGTDHPSIIICKIHGEFAQDSHGHAKGYGCPLCARKLHGGSKAGFVTSAKNRVCTLYVIKCTSASESFYKIGVTSLTVAERFRKTTDMPYMYTVVAEAHGSASDIWELEAKGHSINSNYGYIPSLNFGGYTECFSKVDLSFIP